METVELKNKFLTAVISPLGAELQSLVRSGLQYIWQGDPAFWKRRSPLLFPHIGVLKDGVAIYKNGESCSLGIHGFAKDREFFPTHYQNTRAVFVLESDDASLACYPYPFRLAVEFVLRGSALRVLLEVKNTGTETMPFGIGGHPGFRCPIEEGLAFSDYRIVFEKEENQSCPYFDRAGIYQAGHSRPLLDNTRILPLNHKDYEHNALVFDSLRSSSLELRGPPGKRGLRFCWHGFRYLGIWTLANPKAPFICTEPWTSLPARSDEDCVFDNKHSILFAGPGESFSAWYEIEPF
jgi:galactose mutarotase-like enzyme